MPRRKIKKFVRDVWKRVRVWGCAAVSNFKRKNDNRAVSCVYLKTHIALFFPVLWLCVLNAPSCFEFLAYICVSVFVCEWVWSRLYSEEEKMGHLWKVCVCGGGGTDGPCHICLHLVPSPYEPPNIRIRHESIFCCFFCTNACTYFAVLVPSGTDRRTVQQDTAGMDCCHGW